MNKLTKLSLAAALLSAVMMPSISQAEYEYSPYYQINGDENPDNIIWNDGTVGDPVPPYIRMNAPWIETKKGGLFRAGNPYTGLNKMGVTSEDNRRAIKIWYGILYKHYAAYRDPKEAKNERYMFQDEYAKIPAVSEQVTNEAYRSMSMISGKRPYYLYQEIYCKGYPTINTRMFNFDIDWKPDYDPVDVFYEPSVTILYKDKKGNILKNKNGEKDISRTYMYLNKKLKPMGFEVERLHRWIWFQPHPNLWLNTKIPVMYKEEKGELVKVEQCKIKTFGVAVLTDMAGGSLVGHTREVINHNARKKLWVF